MMDLMQNMQVCFFNLLSLKEIFFLYKQLILQRAKASYREEIKDKLNDVEYINRKEEFIVDQKFHSMFDDNNIFAFVVYGSKGVGKSTLLRKVITNLQ